MKNKSKSKNSHKGDPLMAPLPPLIMTSEEGSFAQETIKSRKPAIIDRILSHDDYTPAIRSSLLKLKHELIYEPIQPLQEETSDKNLWDEDLEPWIGQTWLKIPWFLAETYFFRRVLESVCYFQPGPWNGCDPFRRLKDQEMQDAALSFTKSYLTCPKIADLRVFQEACYQALWGNRGDLSNLDVFDTDLSTQPDQIILNQAEEAFKFLLRKPAKIAYFFDNAGKELFYDLAFVDILLNTGLVSSITGYFKNQPFFVSDATREDLNKTLKLLDSSSFSDSQQLSQRITKAINSSSLKIDTPPFLTTSRMYRDLPTALLKEISTHDLAIFKGDVNYRRLFGDRHWEPTTSVEYAGGYFPTSFLSIRTLKAELILGISLETLNMIEKNGEPDWLINGKWGMITFHQIKT